MQRGGLVILISGRGSNALAIIQAASTSRLPVAVKAVIADRAAIGLDRAAARNIDTAMIPRQAFSHRAVFEAALEQTIAGFNPELIALAGFMRVLSDDFVERHAGRMVNIHPSLLPKYRGLHTHRRALDAGDAEHGASVHWVTPELDAGPVIAQARVPICAGDNAQRLAERVLQQEHRLYPAALALLLANPVGMKYEPSDNDEPPVLDRDFDDAGRCLRPGS